MESRTLPRRERVFILALQYHGYRFCKRRSGRLKKRKGYVIPATKREDADAIDLWVKPPGETELVPVQLTQRGTALYQKYQRPSEFQLVDFTVISERRVRGKQKMCRQNGIAFVLVRDFDGSRLSTCIAWGDIKALRHGLAQLQS